jgi:hypothetical protein
MGLLWQSATAGAGQFFELNKEQEVLGRTKHLLSFDMTQTAYCHMYGCDYRWGLDW